MHIKDLKRIILQNRKPTFAPRSPGGPMYPRGPGDAYKGIVPLNFLVTSTQQFMKIYYSLCR